MKTSFSSLLSASALTAALVLGLAATPALATHTAQGEAEPSPTLDLVGQFVVDIPGLTTDVWALGNYAYIGSFHNPECSFDLTGIRVIDISDPTSPSQVAFVPASPGTRNNDVKVASIDNSHFSGDIMVVTNEQCAGQFHPRLVSNGLSGNSGRGGINIYDVTDPTKPHALKQNFLPKANGIHNTFIWEQGDNAYLIAVDDLSADDVIVVDITKPHSPKEIARTGQNDWPGLNFSEIEGPAVMLHDVWVQENGGKIIAYLSYWDSGLVLLDVTDPANPKFLGDSTYPNPDLSGLPPEGNGHVAVPTADGELVIFGDEDQTKAALFANFSIDGAGSTNQVGGANFGPQPTQDVYPTPGDVVAVAANFGCNAGDFDPAPNAAGVNEVVLVQRGVCFFQDKADNAEAAGYDAYIVFNDAARGDGLLTMGARDSQPVAIAGLFIGNTLGSTMAAAVGNGLAASVDAVFGEEDGEGFMRVMDVTAPADIVELGTYATERTLAPENALASGTRDAHNVVVDGTLAYWAWYYEGIRVVDFSSCQAGGGFGSCAPAEVAHWGGGADPAEIFWGVFRHTLPSGQRLILGSGRNMGLWIFGDL
jgi:hypothetical protein